MRICEICKKVESTLISHCDNIILYVCKTCGIKLLDKGFNLRKQTTE